jgi:phosphoglycerate dehydrogenase-like enzyme
MTIRIAQFVHATHDVLDESFLQEFPEVDVVKATNLETLSDALDGAEIFHVYNSAFTPEFAQLVRDKGRALKWIQFTTVGIDIALKAGLPEGVWVTNSGDVSQRVLAGHAMALMLGVMRGFRRFEPLRAQRNYARQILPRYMMAPDGARMVILGMGRIGQDIARKAKAFDMEVICITRAAAPAVPEIDQVVPREKVSEVLPTADVVMNAMPLDPGTQGFLNAETDRAYERDRSVCEHLSRQGGRRGGTGAGAGRTPNHGRRARRLRARTAAGGQSAVGSSERADDAPCWRQRRA